MRPGVLQALFPSSPAGVPRWLLASGLGVVAVAVAYLLAARESTFAGQIKWADVAVAGLILAASSNVRLLMQGRSNLRARRESLLSGIAGHANGERHAPAAVVVFGDHTRFMHRPDCVLAAGRPVTSASRARAERASRQPCGVCNP